MSFSWYKAKKPILALAPMEGYTDSAFRQLVKKYTPGVICFTEFTSADALKFGSKTSIQKIQFDKSEKPLIVQLFGKHPEHFAQAIKYVEDAGADGIDINMGCPARKVINSQHGSALIKDPERAAKIVNFVAKSTKLPVSVKMRIGFNEYNREELEIFCKLLVDAGAQLLTIHGRTTKQGYSGNADFEPIYNIKNKLKNVLIIGNGDINSPEKALDMLKNLDGLMVGRATFGNPLIMHHIYAALNNIPANKNLPDWLNLAKTHIDLCVKSKGEKKAMLEMRKHLAVYIKGFPGATELRKKAVLVESKKDAYRLLDEIKEFSL